MSGQVTIRDLLIGGLIGWCLWLTMDGGCDCDSERPILKLLLRLGSLLLGLL